MRRLSEGAEAKIFETTIFGRSAVVKVRQEKKYRIRELDLALRRSRTRSEAKLMHKAFGHGVRTPRIIALGKFSIFMERLRGRLLKDCDSSAAECREIGTMLARMHNAGIVHGDFTPANIMLCGGVPYVIDFGLAADVGSTEEKAIDLLLMKRSLPKTEYLIFEKSYAREGTGSRATLERLAEVEKRGRYQVRTLA